MAINDQLSNELKVPALKPGEKKIFRRLLAGKIDPQTKEPYALADFWQSGKAMVYDRFTKESVLLLNVVGSKPIKLPDGKTLMDPIVGMVKWDRTGDKLLTEENFEEYCFLMRSNQNISNPFRNQTHKASFFLVDTERDAKLEQADYDLEMEAAYHCRNCDELELKTIAKKLNIKTPPERLRMEILNRIKQGGGKYVMIAGTNKHVKKRIQISDAEKFNILIFDDLNGKWFFADSNDLICEVTLDKDKVEGLIEFFDTTEGGKKYTVLAKKVKTLYEAV